MVRDHAEAVRALRAHGPYAASLAIAAGLRLPDLGAVPLSAAESAASWAAWSTAAGGPSVLPLLADTPSSAALFGLQTAAFWMLGDGDAAARLAPACAGIATVLLPWALRHALGRLPSITLAVLLALDPLLVGASRFAGGAILTAFAAWAVVLSGATAGTFGVRPHARAVYHDLLYGSAGLLLISGSLAWDVVPPAALLLMVVAQGSDATLRMPRAAAVMLLTGLVVSTSGFTQWDGPQLVSASVSQWLRTWVAGAGPDAGSGWRALAGAELVPLTLGAVGLVMGLLGRRRLQDETPLFRPRAFAVYGLWLLWVLLLTLRPGRSASTWLVLQPPLLLCAAFAVSRLAAVAAAAAWHSGTGPAGRVLGPVPAGIVAGVMAVALLKSGIRARGGDAVWQPSADVTAPAVRHLVRDVRAWRLSTGAGLDILAPSGADPVLGWHFREAPDVRWTASPAAPSAAGRPRLAIAPVHAGGDDGELAVYPLRVIDGRIQVVSVRARDAW